MICDQCQKTFEPARADQRFCAPRCRSAWHRENVPAGTVTSLRPLKRGGWSVTLKYDALPVGLHLGGAAWCEIATSTRTDERRDVK